MQECVCGCGERTEGGCFRPGHDQRLRSQIEEKSGGLLALRDLTNAAADYASGAISAEQFNQTVRKIFSQRGL